MINDPTTLSDGQVSDTTATIYSPSTTKARIIRARFFNTSSSTSQTLNLYITRKNGTRRQQARYEIPPLGFADAVPSDDEIGFALGQGDAFEADATTADTVDYVITG